MATSCLSHRRTHTHIRTAHANRTESVESKLYCIAEETQQHRQTTPSLSPFKEQVAHGSISEEGKKKPVSKSQQKQDGLKMESMKFFSQRHRCTFASQAPPQPPSKTHPETLPIVCKTMSPMTTRVSERHVQRCTVLQTPFLLPSPHNVGGQQKRNTAPPVVCSPRCGV